MAVLVDDLLELLDSTFVLFDDRQEGVLKVLKQRDDGLRTCFVGVQNLRSLDPRQTVLGFSSHERKHPTVFAFPESPTFVRYSGSNELNSYKGTTFTVYLPATDLRSKEDDKETEIKHVGVGRILLMDDEETVRKLLSTMLESFGYSVVAKANGVDTLTCFKVELDAQNSFAAIILDLTVPGGIGGREVAEEMR